MMCRSWMGPFVVCATLALTNAECHCKNTTSCAVFPSTPCSQVEDPDRCQEGWFGIYCQKQNIALRKLCSQSSRYAVDYGAAEAAVDGNATNDYRTCSHTKNDTLGPTWTVNLNTSEKIQHIRLYQRPDFHNTYIGMEIFVGRQMCYNWSSTEHPPLIANVTCRQPLTGTTVTIRIPGRTAYLCLCEVQIFVCSDGWFSVDCDKQCRCLNSTEVCDKITGHCSSGCFPGYTGNDCQAACPNGSYGINCSSSCGNCLAGHSCNKTNGACPKGCAAGWKSNDQMLCQEACPNGTYGINCSSSCGNCLAGHSCNKKNGACPKECAAGWISSDQMLCQEACPNGTYGINCSSSCGNCLAGQSCDKTNGACPKGCAAGWMSNYTMFCQQPCQNGFYGVNCGSRCGKCLNSTSCNKTTGYCPNGCAAGWKDDDTKLCHQRLVGEDVVAGIVGGAAAALFVLAVVVVIAICWKRRKQKDDDSKSPVPLKVRRTKARKQGRNTIINADSPSPRNAIHTPPAMEEDEDAVFSVETEIDGINDAATTYYNWVPPHMRLDNLKQSIREKREKASFQTEYEMIPFGARHPHEAAIKPKNKPKNRFRALYAYDDSRVVLADGEDYINANYIMGYDDTQKYIATQGPKPGTVKDFWRMVWQEDVTQIVMLTRLMEVKKIKCERYWPDISKTESYGSCQVTNTNVTTRADYTVSTFLVENSGAERTVTHYHFTSWPDHGVPSAPALVSFWKLVKQGDMDRGPMVVHCSAGVGRTGAFLALDYLMDEAESNHLNVFMCVSKMRQNRMNMVQTAKQYEFVHDVVLEALNSRGTLYTSSEFDETFGVGKTFTTPQVDVLKKQFELLKEQTSDHEEAVTSEALLPENSSKNRTRQVLPVDPKTIVHDSHSDSTARHYCGLLDHDFFTIVCLDDSKEIAGLYPKANKMLQIGPFSVIHMETVSSGAFVTKRKLTLVYDKEDTEQSVTVFCLRPTYMMESRVSLLELIDAVERIISSDDYKILIHCHDGAGVSGVFCSALNIISRLRLDRDVDIFLTIRELQRVRPQFIQTFDQYKVCYDIVKEYNHASNIYANT